MKKALPAAAAIVALYLFAPKAGAANQLGGGFSFDVADNVVLNLGYRFKGALYIDFGRGTFRGDLYSHNIQAGVTFGFLMAKAPVSAPGSVPCGQRAA